MLDMIKVRYHSYSSESFGRERYHVQFRINKKGAECFRTVDLDEANSKLAELNAKRPGIYSMQKRSTRCDRYGCEMQPLEKTRWEDICKA